MGAREQAQTVLDFDERLTRRVFGYRTVHDVRARAAAPILLRAILTTRLAGRVHRARRRQYYRDGSSARFVAHVRVPLLCMNALDDPICIAAAIPVDECA